MYIKAGMLFKKKKHTMNPTQVVHLIVFQNERTNSSFSVLKASVAFYIR